MRLCLTQHLEASSLLISLTLIQFSTKMLLNSLTLQTWFVSSQNGQICFNLFLIWAIHFLNWLSIYIETLVKTIRNVRTLLIQDGCCSGKCPIALLFLFANGVDVLFISKIIYFVLFDYNKQFCSYKHMQYICTIVIK